MVALTTASSGTVVGYAGFVVPRPRQDASYALKVHTLAVVVVVEQHGAVSILEGGGGNT